MPLDVFKRDFSPTIRAPIPVSGATEPGWTPDLVPALWKKVG